MCFFVLLLFLIFLVLMNRSRDETREKKASMSGQLIVFPPSPSGIDWLFLIKEGASSGFNDKSCVVLDSHIGNNQFWNRKWTMLGCLVSTLLYSTECCQDMGSDNQKPQTGWEFQLDPLTLLCHFPFLYVRIQDLTSPFR
jgi:hypothetical protein